jgi:hypothetical protein
MTEDQVQVDAYEQVRAWLIRLGMQPGRRLIAQADLTGLV